MTRKALWRIVEEMSPQERAHFLDPDRDMWMRMSLTIPGEPEGAAVFCNHTPLYLKARRSFHHSPGWKAFRLHFLQDHPVCVGCGAPATVVHHTGLFTIDLTLIEWGFTWVFDHPECCQALCQDCHYQEHRQMIEAETQAARTRRGDVKARSVAWIGRARRKLCRWLRRRTRC